MANSIVALTDTASQVAELQRRQKLAEALSAQGAAPIEVQSYKGIQAPISPFSALAKVLQTYLGAKQAADAIKGEKEARNTERDQATSYFENLGKTPDIGRFENPVSVEEARQQAAVPALTPVAPAGPPEMMQVGGVPTDMQGGMTPAASVQAPMPQVYSDAQPSAYMGPQATVMPGRETTQQERMASLLQAGMSGNRILEQMAPAMYGKIEGQIEAQGKADKLKAQIAGMTGLTDEQKSAYAQMVDVNPQAAGNFLKDVLTPKEPKPAEYGQMRAAAVERIQRGKPPLPGDDVLLYGARGGAPARTSGGRAPVRSTGQGSGEPTPKPEPSGKPEKPATASEQAASYNVGRLIRAATVIKDATSRTPAASAPGALEAAVGRTPFVNFARGEDRQVVAASQRDLLDALLFLATGAAYNKEQLAGQYESYIPAFSDKPGAVASKQQRLRQLAFDAKGRAGKAWTPELDQALNSLFGPAGTAPVAPAAPATGKSTSSVPKPAEVSQAAWDVMPPENKALFAPKNKG